MVELQKFRDLRPARFKPYQQCSVCRVAKTKPYDRRAVESPGGSFSKILVLGDYREFVLEGMIPNDRIIGIFEIKVFNVLRWMAIFTQPASKSRRKLGVNQELHVATMTTA